MTDDDGDIFGVLIGMGILGFPMFFYAIGIRNETFYTIGAFLYVLLIVFLDIKEASKDIDYQGVG